VTPTKLFGTKVAKKVSIFCWTPVAHACNPRYLGGRDQENEIRRIVVRSQPGQIVCETLSRKNPSQKQAGGVARSVGPEFKPQYHKKNVYLFNFSEFLLLSKYEL
jgi:hypothetical protein